MQVKNIWLIIAFIGIVTSSTVSAQQADLPKETKDLMANLDSLANLSYLKNAGPQRAKKTVNKYGFKPDQIPDYSDSVYERRLAEMAASSPLPYVYNDRVRAFINLYAMRKRDLVEKMLGLSEYYFPIYEEVFNKYDIPQEFVYLSVVESALNPQAHSPANAVGLWQFIYPTARLYRLNIDSYMDERKDPYKASVAAARFIRDLHKNLGDWFLAMAAYNCGAGNVIKAIKRSGGKRTFWEIYNYLPMETRGYVPAFIAANYVFKYHQEHNLYPQHISIPTFVDTVIIDKPVAFKQIADRLSITEEVIKELNPHFEKGFIPAGFGKSFELKLPATKAYAFVMAKDSIYSDYVLSIAGRNRSNLPVTRLDTPKNAAVSNTADSNKAPVRVSDTPQPKDPGLPAYGFVSYTVKAGDRLTSIASWFNVNLYYLKTWNGLRSNRAPVGRRLSIRVPMDKYAYYRRINIMTALQKQYLRFPNAQPTVAQKSVEEENAPEKVSKGVNKLPRTNKVKPSPLTQASEANPSLNLVKKKSAKTSWYIVQNGDTLWSIAQRFPGVSVDDILKANGLRDTRSIRVGQKIKIEKI